MENIREFELLSRIGLLTQALMRTRKDRDKWKAVAEEMEKRWRHAKQRKDELRVKNRELTGQLELWKARRALGSNPEN